MKRILLVVAVVILVPVISFGALMVVTFSGHPALIDGGDEECRDGEFDAD